MNDDPALKHLRWLRRLPGGDAWLASLPELVATCAARFRLDVGEPFHDGCVSFVAPALRDGRDEVILKIQFPHRESVHEAEALRRWNGDGAVFLLDHDADNSALLLERCAPGENIATLGCEGALDVYVNLLPRLWVPARAPFVSLADEAAHWADGLVSEWIETGRPFERRLVDAALDAIGALSRTQGDSALLHQDLHAGNVLRAERQRWLAIDPKPLCGDRELGIAPIVRSHELGHDRKLVLRRFDRLTAELGLDRERARLWTIAQTVAWAFDDDGGADARHVETARWLLEAL